MKLFLKILPWALTVVFAVLFILSEIGNSVGQYYAHDQYQVTKMHTDNLAEYIKSRRDHTNDKAAFEALRMISADQYDGKYEPWINTEIGLIKFDDNGFITDICNVPALLGDSECPPQL